MTDRASFPDPAWPVRRFAVWWLRAKPFNIPAHNETARHIGPVLGVTVYRHEQFQVDFLIGPAQTKVPPHAHPNVDSIECWIAGNETTQGWTDKHTTRHGLTEISAGERHAATFGDCAVSWFSLQKWINSVVPHRIERDWIGAPMDDAHARSLDRRIGVVWGAPDVATDEALPPRPYAVMNPAWIPPRPDWRVVDDYKLPSAADWAEAFNLPHGDGIGGTDT